MQARLSLLAVVLLASGGVLASSLQLPLTIRPSRWLESVRQRMQASRGALAPDTPPPPVISTEAISHRLMTTISVGLPPQKFNVAVDSSSSLLWVTNQNCDASGQCSELCKESEFCEFVCLAKCCGDELQSAAESADAGSCAAAHKFNESASNTFVKGEGSAWVAFYEESNAYGSNAKDYIALGDVTDPQSLPMLSLSLASFGLADEVTGVFTRDSRIDGVLGLGKVNTLNAGAESVLEQAYRQKLVQAWRYTLRTDSSNHKGAITLGVREMDGCYDDYEVLARKNKVNAFNVSTWRFNGDPENTPSAFSGAIALNQPVNTVPQVIFDGILNRTGAYYDEQHNVYRVKCNAAGLVWFGTPIDFKLYTQDMIAEVAPQTCILLLKPSKPEDDPSFILGQPILARYCADFNLATDYLYLAQKMIV